MNVVIYQSLIILIFVMFYGIVARQVQMNGNITENIGSNNTKLSCNFTTDLGDALSSVWILATNITLHDFENVAAFDENFGSRLQPFGKVLFGNASLSPFKKSVKSVSMSFDDLNCKHSRLYKCKIIVITMVNPIITTESEAIGISVQVPPSKPENILLVNIEADASMTTAEDMKHSTAIQTTTVTSTETETLSTLQTLTQNDITAFNNSTLPINDHNTTFSTPSNEDFSSDISHRTTTYYTEQTTTAQIIAEGDNITVVCTGDVGKPPAEHFFQKCRSGHNLYMTYKASETSISDMSENCSYYRTSYLTFQVTVGDNNAVIRCFVNSSMAEPDMYVETAPIEVYYEVSMPTIIKSPNNTYYVVGDGTSIHLTCKSDGNPKPYYHWYKENHNELISTSESWTIRDLNVTNSGIYTCKVSNTFNGGTYINSANVRINIMNKADISTTQSTSTGSSSGAYDKKEKSPQGPVIGGVAGAAVFVVVIIIIIVCFRKKRTSKKPTLEKEPQSLVNSTPKPIAESRKGDYDDIVLEGGTNKRPTVNDGHELEDIREHNKEYLKKQKEEEQKKNESNTSSQPAVYAQVNEATKSKNKQNTETLECVDQQEDGTYAETQEGIYDKSGDRRHKLNENDEHFDTSTNLSTQNSNGDTKSVKQNSHIGSYNNQAFEKDDNRKVATVSPTIRSSGGLQDDEQTNQNRQSQSKKGYENVMGKDQTDASEGDTSHRTAL